jgi:predicted thioesterase
LKVLITPSILKIWNSVSKKVISKHLKVQISSYLVVHEFILMQFFNFPGKLISSDDKESKLHFSSITVDFYVAYKRSILKVLMTPSIFKIWLAVSKKVISMHLKVQISSCKI